MRMDVGDSRCFVVNEILNDFFLLLEYISAAGIDLIIEARKRFDCYVKYGIF